MFPQYYLTTSNLLVVVSECDDYILWDEYPPEYPDESLYSVAVYDADDLNESPDLLDGDPAFPAVSPADAVSPAGTIAEYLGEWNSPEDCIAYLAARSKRINA